MLETGASGSFTVPVVLMVFNRPASTRRVFDQIAQARPQKLLVVADGPRPGVSSDDALCREVRKIVSGVDWPCDLQTNFAASNLGCFERVASGLDWAFTLVEQAVILEDDCFPDMSFFPFCQELLERYRGDSRIAFVSGTNLVEAHLNTIHDYYFSRQGCIWGWATWRSRWQEYDRSLESWPELRSSNALAEIFERPRDIQYWTGIFDAMFDERLIDTWDYQWAYTNFFNNRVAIVPCVNLIMNIGFGKAATHTFCSDVRLMPELGTMRFPLNHPTAILPSRSVDRYYQQLYFRPPLGRRIMLRLAHLLDCCRRSACPMQADLPELSPGQIGMADFAETVLPSAIGPTRPPVLQVRDEQVFRKP